MQISRATRGTRTPDQLITNQLLYQLSYSGEKFLAFKANFTVKQRIFEQK
jgi:hypothetical protein